MTGFAADWLSLREPYDAKARDPKLLAALTTWAARRSGLHVMDLGAGTGSAFRALSGYLPAPTKWTLIENDPALIAAGQALLGSGSSAQYRCMDLSKDLDSLFAQHIDLITASALIDLVSSEWLDQFAARIISNNCAAWIGLTFNGLLRFEPPFPDDDAIVQAFNRDMRRDKGFGVALGPDAQDALVARLAGHGEVLTGQSPWLLKDDDQAIIRATLDGVTTAASGILEAQVWGDARRTGTTSMYVGHCDLLFLPR